MKTLADVEPRPADLASIRTLAATLVDNVGRIDVVLSIAGVLQGRPSRRVLLDGLICVRPHAQRAWWPALGGWVGGLRRGAAVDGTGGRVLG